VAALPTGLVDDLHHDLKLQQFAGVTNDKRRLGRSV
jgi:hypothetical protein